MEEQQYYIVNLNTGKFYSGWENKTVVYVDDKVDAKLLVENQLGKELLNLRLIGELVEYRML